MALRLALFAALITIGTLTREMTGIILWLSLLAILPKRGWLVGFGVLLVGIFAGLRLLVNAPASQFTIGYVLSLNLEAWRLRNLLVYGGMLTLACLWMYANPIQYQAHRRMVIIILVPYVGLTLLFGVWQEVRLWMPIFLLGIPLLKDTHAD